MPLSPFAYVEYECLPVWDRDKEKMLSHAHQVPMGDGLECILGIEEAAELLADAISRCNEDRHNGHGYTHEKDEPEKAYKAAIEQLLSKDFDQEWKELSRKIRTHKMWGGPVPAAVLMPDNVNPKEWHAIIPDKNGVPHTYNLRPHTLQDIIPAPNEKTAIKDEHGIGWRIFRERPKTSSRPSLEPAEREGR